MRESLAELYRGLTAAVAASEAAAERGDLRTGLEAAKAVLSFGSKLHSRLAVLEEFETEARSYAAVDRAVVRGASTEVPGQLTIPAEESSTKPKPRGRRGPSQKG